MKFDEQPQHDKGLGEGRQREDNEERLQRHNRLKKGDSMVDINTGLLVLVVALNGYLAWKAAYIASQIDRKTNNFC